MMVPGQGHLAFRSPCTPCLPPPPTPVLLHPDTNAHAHARARTHMHTQFFLLKQGPGTKAPWEKKMGLKQASLDRIRCPGHFHKSSNSLIRFGHSAVELGCSLAPDMSVSGGHWDALAHQALGPFTDSSALRFA